MSRWRLSKRAAAYVFSGVSGRRGCVLSEIFYNFEKSVRHEEFGIKFARVFVTFFMFNYLKLLVMSTKGNFLAFLGGAAAGAVVALLFAPDKGEETRKKIGKAVADGKERAGELYQTGKKKFQQSYEHGRQKVTETYRKGRERISDAIAQGREMADEELEALRGSVDKEDKRDDKKE